MDATVDPGAADSPRTLGQTLAAERERHGLTRNDLAHRLHMSVFQVEALENGEYERLPKGTFLRGFVRNYAKVVGLESEPLLAMLAEAKPAERSPRVIVPTENIRFDPLGERFSGPYVRAATLALVAIVLAFAAMYWWLFIRPTPPGAAQRAANPTNAASAPEAGMNEAPSAAAAPAPESDTVAPAPTSVAPTSATPPASASRAAPSVGSAAAPVLAPAQTPAKAPGTGSAPAQAAGAPAAKAATTNPADASANAAAPAPGEKVLHFRFKGDSWVEVRDGSGKVVFRQLNAGGSEAEAHGRPPLAVIVGNAPEVEMTESGKPFPLAPYTNVDVARFTVK